MVIETSEIGGGSYPEPLERETRTIKVTINVEYKTELEVPEKWDSERIYEDIKENLGEYINNATIEDYEIEV